MRSCVCTRVNFLLGQTVLCQVREYNQGAPERAQLLGQKGQAVKHLLTDLSAHTQNLLISTTIDDMSGGGSPRRGPMKALPARSGCQVIGFSAARALAASIARLPPSAWVCVEGPGRCDAGKLPHDGPLAAAACGANEYLYAY